MSCGSGWSTTGSAPRRGRPGVGIQSMQERAAELGGVLEVLDTDGGGTTVEARLPAPALESAP